MQRIKFTEQERRFYRETTEKQARAIWKSHTGKNIGSNFSAIVWCVSMGYLTAKA